MAGAATINAAIASAEARNTKRVRETRDNMGLTLT